MPSMAGGGKTGRKIIGASEAESRFFAVNA
jgi:hypothetical protein